MITDKKSPYRLVTVEELAKLREREDKLFNERTPKSREALVVSMMDKYCCMMETVSSRVEYYITPIFQK